MFRSHVLTFFAGLLCAGVAPTLPGVAPTLPGVARADTIDVLAADSRLRTRRSLRARDLSVRDLLADLNQQTGIPFFADPSVADDRLTVFLHDRPLGEAMHAIADLFGWEWQRAGRTRDAGYQLRLTDAARRREQAEKEAVLARCAERIRQEAALYLRLEGRTERQLQERQNEITRGIATDEPSAAETALRAEYDIVRQVRQRNAWDGVVCRFLTALPAGTLQALLRAGAAEYAWPPAPGCVTFSSALIDDARRAHPLDAVGDIPTLEEMRMFRLQFHVEGARTPRLYWNLAVRRRVVRSYSLSNSSGALPTLASLSSPALSPEIEPASWRADPALAAKVSVQMRAPEGDLETPDPPAPRAPTIGEALEQLEEVHPFDVIADALVTAQTVWLRLEDTPLGDAITRLARPARRRWWVRDGIVRLQSLHYAVDRAAEPTSTALARWRERARRGQFELNDAAEVAALPEAKFDTVVRLVADGRLPSELASLAQARRHLLLWNALTRAQRRRARAEGVPFARMTPEQQGAFVAALDDPFSNSVSYLSITDRTASELAAHARMRIEIRQSRLWRPRRSPAVAIVAPSRDEALRIFRLTAPKTQPEDLRPVLLPTILFYYEGERGLLTRGWVSLPPRWEDEG